MFKKEYLDYSDVLIIPNRTSISSRKEVEIKRHFTGSNSNYSFRASPIIVSNLDTTGTQDMAKALESYQISVALHKFHTNQQLRWPKSPYEWVTIGMRDQDWKAKIQHATIAGNYLICIDVANGYMENFLNFIKQVRTAFPQHYIMAGNICTPDMVKPYFKAGADCIKTGLGCFIAGTKIKTLDCDKPIEEIKVGDTVLTHDLSWREVINTFKHTHHTQKITINSEITCTPNHKFYTLHKRFKNIVTNENISEYAEWLEAENITTDYLLIKV